MRRSKGFGRMALMMVFAVALGVAFVAIGSNVNAFDQPIPTKVGLLKPAKLFKLVSKPSPVVPLPACETQGYPTGGGTITATMDGDTLVCNLPAADWASKDTGGWKILGKCDTGKFKGWKYLNKSASDTDPAGPCKVVIIKANVLKIVAKGSGNLPNPVDNDTRPVSISMAIGSDSYCTEWTVPHDKSKADKLLKAKDVAAPGSCAATPCDCTGAGTQLSFVTGIPTGQPPAGLLSNYRCSNNSSSACVDDSDCDVGPCFITPAFCQDLSTPCTQDADCQGTCGEVSAGNLPLDLEVGALYTGGGLNSVPLPLPVPDQGTAFTNVTTGDGQTLTLDETTPGEVGQLNCTQGRTCSVGGADCVLDADCGAGTCQDNCIYGPPLPIPNSGTPATSVCSKNVVGVDAEGTAQCDGGAADLDIGLRSVVYLNGDLFTSSSPPDLPGVQPCPLCVPICSGGSNGGLPCRSDNPPTSTELTDCTGGGGTCPSTSNCLGGPNNGASCIPETSDPAALGDDQDSYPTSQTCTSDPLQDITANIGGLPIALEMTTGTKELNAVDRANGARTFCGFCRDSAGAGTLCFEGDTSGGCPAAIPAADGNAVPCTSDADCTADADEYEACVQRNPGAFSEGAATRISVSGASSGCLGDNNPHAGTLVSIFCIPPTFDATVDAAGDLPGPGGVLLLGEAQLQ